MTFRPFTSLVLATSVLVAAPTFAAAPKGAPPPKAAAAPSAAAAKKAPAPDDEPTLEERQQAWLAENKAVRGPKTLDLGHDVEMALPDGFAWVDKVNGAKLLEKGGSFYNDNLLGIAVSTKAEDDYSVIVRYEDEGFVNDDESIDADELLKAIREGTEEANEERVKRGFKPLHIEGWSEPPRYEKDNHRLVWALIAKDDDGPAVNFNTRMLGRRGYVSLNLVTDPEHLAQYKPAAATLLSATRFKEGARYQDFDKAKDKVAEYGLAGLILGGAGLGAAKLVKVGLLTKILLVGKKAIVAVFIAIGAALKRLFTKKKDEDAPAAATPAGAPAPSVPPPPAE